MSYSTIARCQRDPAFVDRVMAACAQEGVLGAGIPGTYLWDISGAQDIEAAYASALAADNPNPGGDESVISDGMILAYVQANPPQEATP